MSSLRPPQERAYDAYASLVQQWRRASEAWLDAVHDRFDKEYWQQYEPAMRRWLNRIDALDQVIEQAHREVR